MTSVVDIVLNKKTDIQMREFLIDKIFAMFAGRAFLRLDISMGTIYTPLLVDLFF